MKKIVKTVLFILLLTAFLPLHAQLVVSLSFNRTRYMIYEQIYACLTLRNDTGRPLLFGSRPEYTGFILFDIRDSNNRLIFPRKGVEISTHGLLLAPGEVRRIIIPLQKYYDLGKAGTYSIYAYVSHNQLAKEFRSKEYLVHVSEGTEIWRREVGLPDRDEKDKNALNGRKYSIRQMDGDRERYYYLRVEDEGFIYAVTRIGTVHSYMKYDAQVDMLSRIHLLMPVAPRVYHYMLFNVDGTNLESSYWKTSDTIPMLFRNPQSGKVDRIGGARARKGVDFIDPTQGRVSASELMKTPDRKSPEKAGGVVDLGDGLMPVKSADEK